MVLVPVEQAHTLADLEALCERYLLDGYEGQMVRIDAPYEWKRSWTLLKRKVWITEEFACEAIHEGNGNWLGYIKTATIKLLGGVICEPTFKGKMADLSTRTFRKPDWLTVRYFGYTPDGSLRFPTIIDHGFGSRED